MKKTHKISKEIKDQILKRIKQDGVPVLRVAEEHGISSGTIYSWLSKGIKGNPTWLEHNKLKKENESLFRMVGELTVKLSQSQKKS